jgi:transposase
MPKENKAIPAKEEEKVETPQPPTGRPRDLTREELERLRNQLQRKFH